MNETKSKVSRDNCRSERVFKLLAELTLAEKVDLLGGDINHMGSKAVPRLGIPALTFADGPMGVHTRNVPAPAYPAMIGLAASFDREIARRMGTAIGNDCKERNVQVLLGPGVNIHRSPLCGRNFEYCGEDPELAAEMGASYIKGMESVGTAACIKHYVANYQEYDRHGVSSNADERTLREIYLPAFERAAEAGVATFMTAYNPVNGEHMSENRFLLRDILKKEWGYDGLVMSDWTSTYHAVQAVNHGLDLEMPTGKNLNAEQLMPAIANGCVTEEIITDKVRRLLNMMERFGWLDDGAIDTADIDCDAIDDSESERAALDIARAGQVLLKNDDLLPLKKDEVKKLVVVGYQAGNKCISGGGSAHGSPKQFVTLLDGLKQVAGEHVDIEYFTGVNPWRFEECFKNSVLETADGELGSESEYFNNNSCSGEPALVRRDKLVDFFWMDGATPDPAITAELFSVRYRTGFRSEKDGKHVVYTKCSDGGYRLFVNGELRVDYWDSEIAKPTSTELNLSRDEYVNIVIEYRKARHWAGIHLGWESAADFDVDLDEAVEAAKTADAVIVAAGYTRDTESEGFDRDFNLHPAVDAMISRLAEVNRKSIVALYAGSTVDCCSWIDDISALLHLWYPGMNGALAAAEIIFGECNPSGRLPVSWAHNLGDYAASDSYEDHGTRQVQLSEGVFAGYRHFHHKGITPRWPFGFGLSYSDFRRDSAVLSSQEMSVDGEITLSGTICNQGSVDGTDTVMLFIGAQNPRLPRPERELKDFCRVDIEAGSSGEFRFIIKPEMLRYFDPDKRCWCVEPGEYCAIVASHADDPGSRLSFNVI